ncbi:MAG: hypothetical protein WB626_00245 [Bacteroidota bacterium]
MSTHPSYILRLLREVESSLDDGGRGACRRDLETVIQRVSRTDNPEEAVEDLYAVEAYDDFALRLLWAGSREPAPADGLAPDLLAYDAELLLETLPGSGAEPRTRPLSEAREAVAAAFGDALQRMGRLVGQVRHRSQAGGEFRGIPEEDLYRLLDEATALRASAPHAAGKDVERFAAAFCLFLEYALDNGRESDIRVLHIVESANLTLQTTLKTDGSGAFDSLQQTTAMLEDPAALLA